MDVGVAQKDDGSGTEGEKINSASERARKRYPDMETGKKKTTFYVVNFRGVVFQKNHERKRRRKRRGGGAVSGQKKEGKTSREENSFCTGKLHSRVNPPLKEKKNPKIKK